MHPSITVYLSLSPSHSSAALQVLLSTSSYLTTEAEQKAVIGIFGT